MNIDMPSPATMRWLHKGKPLPSERPAKPKAPHPMTGKPKAKRLTEEERDHMRALRTAGVGVKEIARLTMRSTFAVCRSVAGIETPAMRRRAKEVAVACDLWMRGATSSQAADIMGKKVDWVKHVWKKAKLRRGKR